MSTRKPDFPTIWIFCLVKTYVMIMKKQNTSHLFIRTNGFMRHVFLQDYREHCFVCCCHWLLQRHMRRPCASEVPEEEITRRKEGDRFRWIVISTWVCLSRARDSYILRMNRGNGQQWWSVFADEMKGYEGFGTINTRQYQMPANCDEFLRGFSNLAPKQGIWMQAKTIGRSIRQAT